MSASMSPLAIGVLAYLIVSALFLGFMIGARLLGERYNKGGKKNENEE